MLLSYAITAIVLIGLLVGGFKLGELIFSPPQAAAPPVQLPQSDSSTPNSGAAVVNPPYAVHDFTLTNQFGAPTAISSLRGRIVLLFFGYTHCPDECPITMADFKSVKRALGADADKVAFVFVSVDGKRDTPAVVKAFVEHFDPDFIGLTADDATLARMAADYGAMFKIPESALHAPDVGADGTPELVSDNYFVEHTSPSYVIDARGMLRFVYFYRSTPDSLLKGIRQLLNG
jgi:protein SCO1/2